MGSHPTSSGCPKPTHGLGHLQGWGTRRSQGSSAGASPLVLSLHALTESLPTFPGTPSTGTGRPLYEVLLFPEKLGHLICHWVMHKCWDQNPSIVPKDQTLVARWAPLSLHLALTVFPWLGMWNRRLVAADTLTAGCLWSSWCCGSHWAFPQVVSLHLMFLLWSGEKNGNDDYYFLKTCKSDTQV